MLDVINNSPVEASNEHFLVETSAGIQFYMDAWEHQDNNTHAASQESTPCPPQD